MTPGTGWQMQDEGSEGQSMAGKTAAQQRGQRRSGTPKAGQSRGYGGTGQGGTVECKMSAAAATTTATSLQCHRCGIWCRGRRRRGRCGAIAGLCGVEDFDGDVIAVWRLVSSPVWCHLVSGVAWCRGG